MPILKKSADIADADINIGTLKQNILILQELHGTP